MFAPFWKQAKKIFKACESKCSHPGSSKDRQGHLSDSDTSLENSSMTAEGGLGSVWLIGLRVYISFIQFCKCGKGLLYVQQG